MNIVEEVQQFGSIGQYVLVEGQRASMFEGVGNSS
jgi:hypothetical protein